jgi:uncharacterized protein
MSTSTNRLARETSPYLLQHAHNPVDWFAWGREAFEKSRRENKPIFLSVGYSTCYWCHVMERQCFENEAIAGRMNADFVNVKVDREERPDVDQLYMLAVQLMSRQGGWPMSVFLTPDLRPFFGGTYFPPDDAYGRPGFPRVLQSLADAWKNRREDVEKAADHLTDTLRQFARPGAPDAPIRIDREWVENILRDSASDFDPSFGGFGGAPKFPRQTLLEFILTFLRDKKDEDLRYKLDFTLSAMASGGIRDQLGGAFHRYSTDDHWLVPHFEIMLYDNAMLLWIYAEAHRQTPNPVYEAVARGIADNFLNEMRSPAGAFYTALDAEVDGEEGQNYLWTKDQVREILSPIADEQEIARFTRVYGLDAGPNFTDPHKHGDAPAKNVLFIADTDSKNVPPILDAGLAKLRNVLREARRARRQPRLDDKILTSWNALMIRALAHAAESFGENRYQRAAEEAADYLLKSHRDADGGLLRVSGKAGAKFPAFLDDYAFLVQSLLRLGEKYRKPAEELSAQMRERFASAESGFFYTQADADDLIVRQMVGSDSPLPSGNGVAAMVLLELGKIDAAKGPLTAFAGQMQQFGGGMSTLAQAAMEYVKRAGPIDVMQQTKSESVDRPESIVQLAERILDVKIDWVNPARLRLRCTLQEPYHLNPHHVNSDDLIPTRLTVNEPGKIEYPGKSTYRGEFAIDVAFSSIPASGREILLALTYQACDESACLAPVTRHFSARAP